MGEAAVLKTGLAPVGMTYELRGKERFVLDAEELLNLQRYLLTGMVLPATDTAMKEAFLLDDNMLKDFNDLKSALGDIKQHCTVFYNGAYTKAVSLASAVVEFNFSAQYYLKEIIRIADKFKNGAITEESAKEAAKALIKLLLDALSGYKLQAEEILQGISTFEIQSREDNVRMNGQDGKSGLKKKYEDAYGLNTQEIQDLQKDIKEAMRELDEATKDYNHDVTVAATTPTYVWVFPFGTIAAAVVAGVYGDKATKAYKEMGKLREDIRKSEGDLKQKSAMSSCLLLAERQVTRISELVQKAIGPIEKMKTCWNSLSDDLAAVNRTVEKDIKQLPVIIQDVGANKALAQWAEVAKLAKEYRDRAFITETSKTIAAADIIPFPTTNK